MGLVVLLATCGTTAAVAQPAAAPDPRWALVVSGASGGAAYAEQMARWRREITEAQDAGLEVQHEENLRVHYAMTLAGWCRNLETHWDEAVAEVGEGTARVWGLYMAGSRMGFERNEIQLHQVLTTRTDADGRSNFPLRPNWVP